MSDITFVIPTIDRPTIQYAVQSLQTQTATNWRAIIAGDGLIPSFVCSDERIAVMGVHSMRSAGEVRNFVVRNFVQSKWVGFLDDDDELYPEYIQNFLSIKKKCNPDAIVFKMDNYGSIVPDGKSDKWISDEELWYGNIGMSFCVKRSCFDQILFDRDHGEDYRFIKSLYEQNNKIWLSNYLGYHVRKTHHYPV